MFTYKHPHPAVAVDIVVVALNAGRPHVLLIRRGQEPFEKQLALPGGFLKPTETVEAAASRELLEETGVNVAAPQQFGIYSDPGRDPRDRVISIAYVACVVLDDVRALAGSDAAEADWHDWSSLPPLAFDHATILNEAKTFLRREVNRSPIALDLIRSPFRFADFQTATEAILSTPLDKRNFRRQIDERGWVVETDDIMRGRHRPAKLFARAPTT